jgi:enamine deaminase RidA (YjgF/YER057c/UK114 family)
MSMVREDTPPVTRRMQFIPLSGVPWPVEGGATVFSGADGVDEAQVCLCPVAAGSFGTQLDWLSRAYDRLLGDLVLDASSAVFRRFFCSDIANQAPLLDKHTGFGDMRPGMCCATSKVGQQPPPPARVALWACHIRDAEESLDKSGTPASLSLRRGSLSHHWSTGLAAPGCGDSHAQTDAIFTAYTGALESAGMSLNTNAVRTWLFVQHVDTDYAGLVAARRDFFAARGLTADTHYIASTGIEGKNPDPSALVSMDAYAVAGLLPGQVAHLSAPEHLGPTHAYGVTFERATAVSYHDRSHVFLSGTASIDPAGKIVHPGDVHRQLDRTVENAAALLHAGHASFADMGTVLVYVRDPADQHPLRETLAQRFGSGRCLVVVAPVCRPGWLVEIEGIAVREARNPGLPRF